MLTFFKFYNDDISVSSSSSDEDEDYHRDVQLKNDIHQLERALNNVDTKFDRESRSSRHVHVSAPVARYEAELQRRVFEDFVRAKDTYKERNIVYLVTK